MYAEKMIGKLLISGSIGVIIPYIFLIYTFQYPAILREDSGVVLTAFEKGGSKLIFTWWLFAILGLPLLVAYIKMGQLFANRLGFIRWVTIVGIISAIAQIIGLLRWVFVVPVLAKMYIGSDNKVEQYVATGIFKAIHQFGGVLLGEHIGQLFTIIWSVMMCIAFLKLNYFPRWLSYFGLIACLIYSAAQAELFATVIKGFPVWEPAGFIGSTLWLNWLFLTGIFFMKNQKGDILKSNHPGEYP